MAARILSVKPGADGRLSTGHVALTALLLSRICLLLIAVVSG
jgi:hypothetical protein